MRNSRRFLWHKETPLRKVRLWLVGACITDAIATLILIFSGVATNNELLQHLAFGGLVIELIIGIIAMPITMLVKQLVGKEE